MAFSPSFLQEKVLKLITQPVTEEEVDFYDHLNFYTVLSLPRTASPEEVFAAWCAKVNAYNTSSQFASLPSESPERLAHEDTLKMIARVLCSTERRCLYDIKLVVREGIQFDWSTVKLTAEQGEYLRRVSYTEMNRQHERMIKAHGEFLEAVGRFNVHYGTLQRIGF